MRPVVAVVGPTATGKSDLAINLARHLDGEVINADAMQLYRGMDIGTAKVSSIQRQEVPHHQLDVLDVTQEASVAAYQRHSRADMAAIRARGKTPVLCGGSGLYVRAALDRLDIPPTDPTVRARLDAELAATGTEAMYVRLHTVDPVAADRIEPRNGRRIVRALEVVELTGQPFSATMPDGEFREPTLMIGLAMSREDLDRRIVSRVRRMWDEGMLDEVRRLLPYGIRHGRTSSAAIGYRQALAQLDGDLTREQAIDETASATRRLARRQQSWFGPDQRICWLPADADDLLDRALRRVQDNG